VDVDRRNLVPVLKSELAFLERGGYWSESVPSWRAPLIFQDSPTCLNVSREANANPCSKCALMQFVPSEHVTAKFPCRHIPLNQQGETLESLYHSGTQEEIETAVAKWLRAKIRELEGPADEKSSRRIGATTKAAAASNVRGDVQSEGGQV
jgi:hypothetical protein